MRTILAAAAALALLAGAGVLADAATVAPRSASRIADSGIGMDWYWVDMDVLSSTLTAQTVRLYAEAGVKWARVRPHWPDSEPIAGAYNDVGVDHLISQLRANGIKILLSLEGENQALYGGGNAPTAANGALTPWLAWVDHEAARYGTSVDAWEIWNEPNLTWAPSIAAEAAADFADYSALVRQTADTIRARVPNAFILLGGTSAIDVNFLQKVVPATGSRLNAVGIHPYRGYPEQSQDAWGGAMPNASFVPTGAADYFAEIAKVRQILATAGFPNLEVWSDECTYPTQAESGIWSGTLTQQAKNLIKYYVSSLSAGVSKTFWWRTYDHMSLLGNVMTAPNAVWQDDYNNIPGYNSGYLFATFSTANIAPAASTVIGARTYTASSGIINLAGSTITATVAFPANSVTYTVNPPAGDYAVWLRSASTDPATPAIANCEINGSTFTVAGGFSHDYYAINNLAAVTQGKSTFDSFYYAPCLYYVANNAGLFNLNAPVVFHANGSPAALRFSLLGPTTKVEEVRLVPLGALTEKPAMTPLRTLASLFDDRVGRSPGLGASFSQGTLSAGEWSAFRSAAFTTGGGMPLVAYWIGQQPVDSLADRTATVTLSAPIEDAVVIDPLNGTYAPLAPGKANTFTLRVQDYPLILTGASALSSITQRLLLAEETYNYPNPARGDTTYLRFYLTQASHVKLEIFNAAHARVYESSLDAPAGKTAVPWRLGGVADGVYFLKVSAGGQSVVKKIVVLR